MIAVKASDGEQDVVREFFELFKTPWEFYQEAARCDVLICSRGPIPNNAARLVLIYGDEQTEFDRQHRLGPLSRRSNRVLSFKGDRLPIYGTCLAFTQSGEQTLLDESTREPIAVELVSQKQTIIRIGFDLFQQVDCLLTRGQPTQHAAIPALDLHIALLRDLILGHLIPLVEIPPIPVGHNFIACLTHDVDHAGIRHHKLDHTMVGFLYRATIGSLINFLTGRGSTGQLAANWRAAFSLPFVYLGLARDFWKEFDRYLDLERNLPSTFFVVPIKNNAGRNGAEPAPRRRATRYDVSDIGEQLERLAVAGCEIGCHGIDAWHDNARGTEELRRIKNATGSSKIGVRSHWLYFDESSPRILEQAGFAYDSSVGYNEAIGYRAGTLQVFKPIQARELLELPMHIMDTALFYRDRMNLSPVKARKAVARLAEETNRFGGVLTVNWHDRSIAPERLWGDTYTELVDDLRQRGAWFATANQAVSWFKKRRDAKIDKVVRDGNSVAMRVSLSEVNHELPGLRVRLHESPSRHVDMSVTESQEVKFPSDLATTAGL